MSINKKNLLGRSPEELGIKDAVHVAIVSLRAGQALKPADHITLNDEREAVRCDPSKSFGVVNPFVNGPTVRGTWFWGLLHMQEVPSVQHHWDHPEHSFAAPTTEPKRNKYLSEFADKLGITYEALMAACQTCAIKEQQTPYSAPLSQSDFDKAWEEDRYDIWSEWSEESGHDFYNNGTECCPEYDYPDNPFEYVAIAE